MLPPPSLWGCVVRGRGQSDGLGYALHNFTLIYLCPMSPAPEKADHSLTHNSRR